MSARWAAPAPAVAYRLGPTAPACGHRASETDLAAASTQRSISYYENDDGIPPASIVIALAKALRVSTDELLGVKPSKVERIEDGRAWNSNCGFRGM